MKNKKMWIAAVCAVAFALLLVITVKDLQGDYTSSGRTNDLTGVTRPSYPEQTDPSRPTQPGQVDSGPVEEDQNPSQEPETKGEEDNGFWDIFVPKEVQDSHEDTTEPFEEDPIFVETEPVRIQFPYTIPETNLVIKTLTSYTGVFLEDGSDVKTENMATVVLSNESQACVDYADIALTALDGTEYHFIVSGMTPGSMAVVMESGCALYEEKEYTSCTVQLAEVAAFSMSEELVSVEEDEDGALVVENISGVEIPCVRVFYKFYMESMDAYIGGITYTAKITNLAVGESRTVMPSHYASGYSKVIIVKTYDSAE